MDKTKTGTTSPDQEPRNFVLQLTGAKFIFQINNTGGSVSSDLHASPQPADETDQAYFAYEGGVDVLESFLLALACAGIDVQEPRFCEALQTTIDAMGNCD